MVAARDRLDAAFAAARAVFLISIGSVS